MYRYHWTLFCVIFLGSIGKGCQGEDTPQITVPESTIEGDNITLICTVSEGNMFYPLEWFIHGTMYSQDCQVVNPKDHLTLDCDDKDNPTRLELTISQAKWDRDDGTYKCQRRDDDHTVEIDLNVFITEVGATENDMKVEPDRTATLECKTGCGKPKAEFTWESSGETVVPNEATTLNCPDSSLMETFSSVDIHFNIVGREKTKVYACCAKTPGMEDTMCDTVILSVASRQPAWPMLIYGSLLLIHMLQ